MAEGNEKKLAEFLREVSNWTWDEFVRAEHDDRYTSNEAIIFSIIRSCALQKLDAIKMSLNRLDGKLKTPILVEYPKIYYLYPNASMVMDAEFTPISDGGYAEISKNPHTTNELTVIEPEIETTTELATMSLRETLTKMADAPRELPNTIIRRSQSVERAVNRNEPIPTEGKVPMVKSVVAAHLLDMAANRNLAAATEVFDQIDGKLAETIQLLGEDIYITNYSRIAPENAKPNEQGVMQVEAIAVQNQWAEKLKELLK